MNGYLAGSKFQQDHGIRAERPFEGARRGPGERLEQGLRPEARCDESVGSFHAREEMKALQSGVNVLAGPLHEATGGGGVSHKGPTCQQASRRSSPLRSNSVSLVCAVPGAIAQEPA
ncbi:hypothetical protein TgHK011_003129 [Trichoderma gracile]|nr:hypothetical protein TgHK011_003129 [Trichoderma gracile]